VPCHGSVSQVCGTDLDGGGSLFLGNVDNVAHFLMVLQLKTESALIIAQFVKTVLMLLLLIESEILS
jgi:hypothetical protein